jgi:arabinofuranosyltransferase
LESLSASHSPAATGSSPAPEASDRACHKREGWVTVVLAVLFVSWAAVFIKGMSMVDANGHRHFALFDDAMISMRYAWNLAHGHGLVLNPGERVEGYSNLLLVLLMTGATAVFSKASATLCIQVLGVATMLGIAAATRSIASLVARDEPGIHLPNVRVVAFASVLAYYPLAYWALMGMETALLTLLLLGGLYHVLRFEAEERGRSLVLASGCLALAYLTRNDSLLVSLVMGTYALIHLVRRRRLAQNAGPLALGAGLLLVTVAGQWLWRRGYYHSNLPNTYALRVLGLGLVDRVLDGLRFMRMFLVETIALSALAVGELLFSARRPKVLLAALALTIVFYQIVIGGDFTTYWRFLCPAIPFLFILAITGAAALEAGMARTSAFAACFLRRPMLGTGSVRLYLLGVFMGLVLYSIDSRFLPEMTFHQAPDTTEYNHEHIGTALNLDEILAPQATLGVFGVGAVSYYTGRRSIDFLGKTDPHIARLPPDTSGTIHALGMKGGPAHNKYDLNYSIRKLQPTYVEGFTWGNQDLFDWAPSAYVEVTYKGQTFWLLRDSPLVYWDKLGS